MKPKLIFTFILSLSVLGFLFISNGWIPLKSISYIPESIQKETPSIPPSNGRLDKFYIGAIAGEEDYHCYQCEHYTQLDSLGFNLWHQYLTASHNTITHQWYPASPYGFGVPEDTLMGGVINYITPINDRTNTQYSHKQRKLMMTRPKIEWLCYGQRSDYRCVDVNYIEDQSLWFYTFQSPGHVGQDIPENGYYVRHCRPANSTNQGNWIDDAGMVISRLRSNTEQCKRTTETKNANQWQADTQFDWLIKPRIKIDSAFANNHNNDSALVCRVDVKNQDNNLIKSFDIRVRNFKPKNDSVYRGNYLEEFYFLYWSDTSSQNRIGDWGDKWLWNARGNETNENLVPNHADIQVYWYGNCDMWIDYVRVDNDVAHDLLSNNSDNPNWVRYNNWLDSEVTEIGLYQVGEEYPILYYYIELCEFNNLSCMAYVNSRIKQISNTNLSIIQILTPDNMSLHLPWSERTSIWDADFLYEHYIQKVGFTAIFSECYPFNACSTTNQGSSYQRFSKVPNTLPKYIGDTILAEPVSPTAYDNWLQSNLDTFPSVWEGGPTLNCDGSTGQPTNDMHQRPGQFRDILQICNQLSKMSNLPIIFMPQAHAWYCGWEVHREPTNEELDMTSNVIVSYGAKSLLYFWFPSFPPSLESNPPNNYYNSTNNSSDFGTGMADAHTSGGYSLRQTNYYDQNQEHGFPGKADVIKSISNRMVNKWGPYLINFDNTNTNSYIYRFDNERASLLSNSYFTDIVTYIPGETQHNCTSGPDGDNPSGLIYECNEDRYLQVATFNNPDETSTKYFMIVNRRCSPFIDTTTEDKRGGRRFVRIRFDENSSGFANFVNWKIIDLIDNSTVLTFDKTQSTLNDLGWYMPGEGKLYKIVPVMIAGGELVADDSLSNVSITVLDTIISNHKRIIFSGNNNNIYFTDSATIIMTESKFQVGEGPGESGPNTNKFYGFGNNNWNGLKFNNDTVKIYNTEFKNIGSPIRNYAIELNNCFYADIRNNTFVLNTDTATGAVIAYYSNLIPLSYEGLYINYNSITMSTSQNDAIKVQGFAGLTLSPYINNNTITSSGNSNGIFITSVTGGVISTNSITGCYTGILSSGSNIDIYNNTITNTICDSKGIFGNAGSYLNMNPSIRDRIGGYNEITNTYNGTHNINLEVDLSLFDIEDGNNIFDVYTQSYHIFGTFPENTEYNEYAYYNCFKFDGNITQDPADSLTIGSNSVNLYYDPFSCEDNESEGSMIIALGGNMYDTILINGSGSGGSYSNKSIILTPKTLLDSISLQIRFKDYIKVKQNCYQLINAYPDSIECIASINPLFLATIMTDTTTSSMQQLKTFYETLILNHGYNTYLVKRCNYLVQKCKVRLREYQSALTGFQQIINENPYSYEGLLAHWDYMATSLLMQGYGGGEKEFDDTDISDTSKTPFTKWERKSIKETINKTIEINANNDREVIKQLEKRASDGDLNAREELKVKNVLKDINKAHKPKNISEHISIVNSDVSKLFSNPKPVKLSNQNILPMQFNLSQNFPNPFNPKTTIKYEL